MAAASTQPRDPLFDPRGDRTVNTELTATINEPAELRDPGANSGCDGIAPLPDYRPQDAQLFVAPWGNNRNPGSRSLPLRSLGHAAKLAVPGAVVMIRGGVYRSAQRINHGGKANRPIEFVPWPGEKPVFDGRSIAMPKSFGLIQVNASHLIFDGIEIRNSTARGFSVFNSRAVTLRRAHVHHTQQQGYAGSGVDLTVELSRFHDLVLSQTGSGRTPDWSAGISTWYQQNTKPSSRFVFRNNRVRRVWGECIIALHTTHSLIHDNDVRDCYSVGIYVDNARIINIQRNLIARTSSRFDRENGRGMSGISIAQENYERSATEVDNIVVANNLISGTYRGITFFDDTVNYSDTNSYSRVVVAHNVLCEIERETILFENAKVSPRKRNLFLNNIFCGTVNAGRRSVQIADMSRWLIRNNLFANRSTFNEIPGNRLGSPQFVNGRGLKLRNYRLKVNSPLRAQTTTLRLVPFDGFCNQRNRNKTSVGLDER